MWNRQLGYIAFLCAIPVIVIASDVGVIGQTYPIAEIDFLDFIEVRLKTMQENGELQKIQNQFKQNVSKHADRPRPITGISKAINTNSWIFDPSIVVPYDLMDATGRVFAQKGTRINPLSYVTIHQPMVFINGDDESQIMWALNNLKVKNMSTKIVLVNGSVADMAKIFQQPVYFDQEGRLTTRFHIQHVPAIVYQEKDHLKVTEVSIS